MFQITAEEAENLKCQNGASSYESETGKILRSQNVTSSWGGARYLPYAFTEQGVYVLTTVLRGELAVKQSRALVRAFRR